ncbi:hypothetical protein V8F20_002929 [Naviculisporaceae sp. PSN 640]
MSHSHSLPSVGVYLPLPTNTEILLYHYQPASSHTPKKQLLLTCSSSSSLSSPPSSSSSSSTADMTVSSSSLPLSLPQGSITETSSQPSLPRRVFSDLSPRIWNGLIAILMAMVAQFLVAGIECLLGDSSTEFPASILAMAFLFCLIWTVGLLVSGVDGFYERHLKCAADLLNRHMSVGFTIPFIMICRNPVADSLTIGLIIACFVFTGLVNSVLAYALALPIQSLVVRWDTRSWDCSTGEDEEQTRTRCKSFRLSANSCDSEFTESSSADGQSSSSDETLVEGQQTSPEQSLTGNKPTSWTGTLRTWALQNPLLLFFWLLTLTVGIPLRHVFGSDGVLSICLLFAVWLTALAIQGSIKASQRLCPWVRTLLFGIFNPVLWTSLAMIGYAFADAAISYRSVHDILADLQGKHPVSKRIASLGADEALPLVSAGDIALSILNSGLVAWGFKLYEYRRQLLSRAGLTVFLVSSLLALGNIVLGPLFAHTAGLRPAKSDLAFAARSVTIALASPVMTVLGGDDGLNAAMVVISGILYQMALGFGFGAWLEERLTWSSRPAAESGPTSATTTHAVSGTGRCDLEAQASDLTLGQGTATHDPRTVAAGVTIGINSAAMGTAYLYETHSDAAPYSALSMIALGIMTVGFSAIKPLMVWIVEQISMA